MFLGVHHQYFFLDFFQVRAAQRVQEQNSGSQQHRYAGDQPKEDFDAEYGRSWLVEQDLPAVLPAGDKHAAHQHRRDERVADELGGLGQHGIDAEEGPFAAHARAHFILVRHLGKKQVGQRLRTGEPKARQRDAHGDQPGGHEDHRDQANSGDQQQHLLGLHDTQPGADKGGYRHANDQRDEQEQQQVHRPGAHYVVGDEIDHRQQQRLHQDRHKISRYHDQEGFAGEGILHRFPQPQRFVRYGELGPFLHLQRGDDNQHHCDQRHDCHGDLQRGKVCRHARLRPEHIRDLEANNHADQAEQGRGNLQAVALRVRLRDLRQQRGIYQANDRISGVIQQHRDEHPPEHAQIARAVWHQPDQRERHRQERRGKAHVGDAPPEPGTRAVGDVPEQRVVNRVPNGINQPGLPVKVGIQAFIIQVKLSQQPAKRG